MSEPIDPREPFGEHGEWDALAVGWALSALDPEDEERFAEHLPDCARCTATVREALYTRRGDGVRAAGRGALGSLKAQDDGGGRGRAADTRRGAGARGAGGAGAGAGVAARRAAPRSPGYGIDWFARPARPKPGADQTELGIHQPPVGERRPPYRAPSKRPDRDAPPRPAHRPAAATHADRPPQPARPSDPAAVHQNTSATRSRPRCPLGGRRRRVAGWVGTGVAAAACGGAHRRAARLEHPPARPEGRPPPGRGPAGGRDRAAHRQGPAKVAALTANGQPSPDRRATLVVRGDHIEIIVESLGPTTGNETYWLWTLRCDTPQPTDLKPIRGFTVTQSEFSVRDIGSDPGVASAPCFAISSEEGTATPKAPRQVVAVGPSPGQPTGRDRAHRPGPSLGRRARPAGRGRRQARVPRPAEAQPRARPGVPDRRRGRSAPRSSCRPRPSCRCPAPAG